MMISIFEPLQVKIYESSKNPDVKDAFNKALDYYKSGASREETRKYVGTLLNAIDDPVIKKFKVMKSLIQTSVPNFEQIKQSDLYQKSSGLQSLVQIVENNIPVKIHDSLDYFYNNVMSMVNDEFMEKYIDANRRSYEANRAHILVTEAIEVLESDPNRDIFEEIIKKLEYAFQLPAAFVPKYVRTKLGKFKGLHSKFDQFLLRMKTIDPQSQNMGRNGVEYTGATTKVYENASYGKFDLPDGKKLITIKGVVGILDTKNRVFESVEDLDVEVPMYFHSLLSYLGMFDETSNMVFEMSDGENDVEIDMSGEAPEITINGEKYSKDDLMVSNLSHDVISAMKMAIESIDNIESEENVEVYENEEGDIAIVVKSPEAASMVMKKTGVSGWIYPGKLTKAELENALVSTFGGSIMERFGGEQRKRLRKPQLQKHKYYRLCHDYRLLDRVRRLVGESNLDEDIRTELNKITKLKKVYESNGYTDVLDRMHDLISNKDSMSAANVHSNSISISEAEKVMDFIEEMDEDQIPMAAEMANNPDTFEDFMNYATHLKYDFMDDVDVVDLSSFKSKVKEEKGSEIEELATALEMESESPDKVHEKAYNIIMDMVSEEEDVEMSPEEMEELADEIVSEMRNRIMNYDLMEVESALTEMGYQRGKHFVVEEGTIEIIDSQDEIVEMLEEIDVHTDEDYKVHEGRQITKDHKDKFKSGIEVTLNTGGDDTDGVIAKSDTGESVKYMGDRLVTLVEFGNGTRQWMPVDTIIRFDGQDFEVDESKSTLENKEVGEFEHYKPGVIYDSVDDIGLDAAKEVIVKSGYAGKSKDRIVPLLKGAFDITDIDAEFLYSELVKNDMIDGKLSIAEGKVVDAFLKLYNSGMSSQEAIDKLSEQFTPEELAAESEELSQIIGDVNESIIKVGDMIHPAHYDQKVGVVPDKTKKYEVIKVDTVDGKPKYTVMVDGSETVYGPMTAVKIEEAKAPESYTKFIKKAKAEGLKITKHKAMGDEWDVAVFKFDQNDDESFKKATDKANKFMEELADDGAEVGVIEVGNGQILVADNETPTAKIEESVSIPSGLKEVNESIQFDTAEEFEKTTVYKEYGDDAVGVAAWKANGKLVEAALFPAESEYGKGVYRMASLKQMELGTKSLVKIDHSNGNLHFLTDEAKENDKPEFESKGVKSEYVRILKDKVNESKSSLSDMDELLEMVTAKLSEMYDQSESVIGDHVEEISFDADTLEVSEKSIEDLAKVLNTNTKDLASEISGIIDDNQKLIGEDIKETDANKEIGNKIADFIGFPKNKYFPDHYNTGWGQKSGIGVFRVVRRYMGYDPTMGAISDGDFIEFVSTAEKNGKYHTGYGTKTLDGLISSLKNFLTDDLGVRESRLIGEDTEDEAMEEARRVSKEEGVVQHVHSDGNDYWVSDWYDHETNIATFINGVRESVEDDADVMIAESLLRDMGVSDMREIGTKFKSTIQEIVKDIGGKYVGYFLSKNENAFVVVTTETAGWFTFNPDSNDFEPYRIQAVYEGKLERVNESIRALGGNVAGTLKLSGVSHDAASKIEKAIDIHSKEIERSGGVSKKVMPWLGELASEANMTPEELESVINDEMVELFESSHDKEPVYEYISSFNDLAREIMNVTSKEYIRKYGHSDADAVSDAIDYAEAGLDEFDLTKDEKQLLQDITKSKSIGEVRKLLQSSNLPSVNEFKQIQHEGGYAVESPTIDELVVGCKIFHKDDPSTLYEVTENDGETVEVEEVGEDTDFEMEGMTEEHLEDYVHILPNGMTREEFMDSISQES